MAARKPIHDPSCTQNVPPSCPPRKPNTAATAPVNNKTTGGEPGPIKLPVSAEPASFSKIASILLLYACKRVLLVRTTIKLTIYIALLFIVSMLTDHFPFPKSYFSDKRNFLNQYFVKLGWGWTCSVVGLFIYFTSHTYCCGDRRAINRHLCRLAVSTVWWYVSVLIFDYVHETVGMCMITLQPGERSLGRNACEVAGRRWISFDISGHTFLLIHCLLIISEESRAIGNGWERIPETLTKEEQSVSSPLRLTADEIGAARESSTAYSRYVLWIVLSMTILTLIWELMLFTTILYFHNLPQKMIGALFAILGWVVTYRVWYRKEGGVMWSPRLPGQGRFKYLKD